MDFNYEQDTLHAYKNRDTARTYLESYEKPKGIRGFRFWLVARSERAAIRTLLAQVSADKVLDIPCGTGKLAPVFAEKTYQIVAADISPEMIELAREAYLGAAHSRVRFEIADATALPKDFKGAFDLVVCLRLLHRVPLPIAHSILNQFAGCARFAIVSFGINSLYHRVRRKLRNALFGGGVSELCTQPLHRIREVISQHFRIIAEKRVSPLLSEEVVFLLERRESPE
jgi:SAM-dependent methyltransferase